MKGESVRYKCIKEMCLPKYDCGGFEIPNKYGFVPVGSIWKRDDAGNIIGGDIHLDSVDNNGNFEWIEISVDSLKENFVLIE